MPLGLTGLETTTLALALVGTVTGVLALAVQVALFSLSGSRVTVEALQARLGPGEAVTGGPAWEHNAENWPIKAVAVRARNRGRQAVDVTGWSVIEGKGIGLVETTRAPHNKPVPHRLEPGASETWYLIWDDVAALVATSRTVFGTETRFVRGQVQLGTGRTIASSRRRSIRLS